MSSDMLKFFETGRQVFGVCPCCGEIFRLSEANVYLKKKPIPDWMDKYEQSERRVDSREEMLLEQEGEMREVAREKGRKQAMRAVKKVDKVFAPNSLNADDAKVLFHPIDYMVFNGMKKKPEIKNILLLDRKQWPIKSQL